MSNSEIVDLRHLTGRDNTYTIVFSGVRGRRESSVAATISRLPQTLKLEANELWDAERNVKADGTIVSGCVALPAIGSAKFWLNSPTRGRRAFAPYPVADRCLFAGRARNATIAGAKLRSNQVGCCVGDNLNELFLIESLRRSGR
jgi:hypothetical protein